MFEILSTAVSVSTACSASFKKSLYRSAGVFRTVLSSICASVSFFAASGLAVLCFTVSLFIRFTVYLLPEFRNLPLIDQLVGTILFNSVNQKLPGPSEMHIHIYSIITGHCHSYRHFRPPFFSLPIHLQLIFDFSFPITLFL